MTKCCSIYIGSRDDWAFEALFERYHALIRSFVLASYYVKRMAQFDIDECIQECEICFYQCTQYYCETLNTTGFPLS